MNAPLNTVLVRLEIDSMRHSILHALVDHHDEIQSEVGRVLDKVVKDFDFLALVKKEAETVVREALVSALRDAVTRIVWEDDIQNLIGHTMEEKVRKAVSKMLDKE